MKLLYPMLAALLVAQMADAQTGLLQTAQSVADLPIATFSGPGGLGTADTAWMQEDAHNWLFEFEASRLAKKKAQSPDTRKFAQKLVGFYASSNEDLHDIASDNEVMLPDRLDAAQQAELNRLRSLNGAAFDPAYLKDMRQAKQHDLAAERAEIRIAHDRALLQLLQVQLKADLKQTQWAKRLQPTQTASRNE